MLELIQTQRNIRIWIDTRRKRILLLYKSIQMSQTTQSKNTIISHMMVVEMNLLERTKYITSFKQQFFWITTSSKSTPFFRVLSSLGTCQESYEFLYPVCAIEKLFGSYHIMFYQICKHGHGETAVYTPGERHWHLIWLNCWCWGNWGMVEGQFSKWF